MLKLKIEGDKIDDILEFLSNGSTNDEVYKAGAVKEINNRKIGFFVYEVFYLRTQGTVSCSYSFVRLT